MIEWAEVPSGDTICRSNWFTKYPRYGLGACPLMVPQTILLKQLPLPLLFNFFDERALSCSLRNWTIDVLKPAFCLRFSLVYSSWTWFFWDLVILGLNSLPCEHNLSSKLNFVCFLGSIWNQWLSWSRNIWVRHKRNKVWYDQSA